MTVDLEPVAQAGLDDAHAPVDLVDEAMDVGHEIGVDLADRRRGDGAEQQPAETGRRIDGQHEIAERDAPRGC